MKLSIGDIIEVHGFVMLSRLDPGRYRVKTIDNYHGIPTYRFTKPRGHKVLVRHACSDVDCWVKESTEDLNKIEKVVF